MIFCSGCGSRPPGESHITGYSAKQLLGEFSELYRCVQVSILKQRAPTRLQDLEASKVGFARGYQAVVDGEIVVIWGAPIGTGSGILAYEKDAPDRGGWVLLQDGSIKEMTSAEFHASPKAART